MPTTKKQLPPKKILKVKPSVGHAIMNRIEEINFDDEGLKFCLYGLSGSGKTTLASTWPGKILWIVCSGGKKPGELRSVNTPELRKKIKKIDLGDPEDIFAIAKMIEDEQNFATVVLDHISGFQDRVLSGILDIDELPEQKSWGLATQEEYGQCTLQCKRYIRSLLDLSCHVLILGQERIFGDESNSETIKPTVGTAVSPSLASWLHPACDYVGQMFKRRKMVQQTMKLKIKGKSVEKVTWKPTKEIEYCFRTAPHDTYITKFRVPKGHKLPEVIVDPSYEKIMKIIEGE